MQEGLEDLPVSFVTRKFGMHLRQNLFLLSKTLRMQSTILHQISFICWHVCFSSNSRSGDSSSICSPPNKRPNAFNLQMRLQVLCEKRCIETGLGFGHVTSPGFCWVAFWPVLGSTWTAMSQKGWRKPSDLENQSPHFSSISMRSLLWTSSYKMNISLPDTSLIMLSSHLLKITLSSQEILPGDVC
jgi:hypothetical protein